MSETYASHSIRTAKDWALPRRSRSLRNTSRNDAGTLTGTERHPGVLAPRERRLTCKIVRAFVDGEPSGGLTREHIVDNITLYWLTGTGASAARSYWEEAQEGVRAIGQAVHSVSIPVGFTTFPGEIWRTPRSWVERAYPDVDIYFNEVDKGGHFGAWEEPQLFAEEMRATFRPLR